MDASASISSMGFLIYVLVFFSTNDEGKCESSTFHEVGLDLQLDSYPMLNSAISQSSPNLLLWTVTACVCDREYLACKAKNRTGID